MTYNFTNCNWRGLEEREKGGDGGRNGERVREEKQYVIITMHAHFV